MRRFVILAGPVAFAAFVFACEDDPQNNPTLNFPEAGSPDTFRPPVDGAPPQLDAQPDVAVDAAPNTVSVRVLKRNVTPSVGVTVIFHDANGLVLETKTTDATGLATSTAGGPIPAMATALLGKDIDDKELLTWTGVEAGDELIAAEPEKQANLGTYSVTIPGTFGDAGEYEVRFGGCQSGQVGGGEPIVTDVFSDCVGPLNAPLVQAFDNGEIVGVAFKKNVPAPDGGNIDVNALTGWNAVTDFTVKVLNKPGIQGPVAHVLEIANNIGTRNAFPRGLDQGDEAKFKVGTGYADAYQASIDIPGTTFYRGRSMSSRLASNLNSVTFDCQQALPELSETTLDTTDKLRPTASWTAASALAGTDGGFIKMNFFAGGQSESSVHWTIVVPPSAGTTGTVKAPALPASGATAWIPDGDAGQSWSQFITTTFAEADSLADYKAFRKFQGIVNQAANTPAAVLPTNGSFKTTVVSTQPPS